MSVQLDFFGDLFDDSDDDKLGLVSEVQYAGRESSEEEGAGPDVRTEGERTPGISGDAFVETESREGDIDTGDGVRYGGRGVSSEGHGSFGGTRDGTGGVGSERIEGLQPTNYAGKAFEEIPRLSQARKIEANLEAIAALKTIESENRLAREDEKERLALYSGWGGLAAVFKEDNSHGARLRDLLSEAEYRSARASTPTAHYTDPMVARFMFESVKRMGIEPRSKVLEPAIGSGMFLSQETIGDLQFDGVEIDSISARIASQLFQTARIVNSGYQDLKAPVEKYDLVISNVPFSENRPYEPAEVRTPGLKNRYALHDFYFLKSLYATRVGGLVAFITSRYTMDKVSSEVRQEIAKKADLVMAVRLPNSAFKAVANTEVVTDILFLQRRAEGTTPSRETLQFTETNTLLVGEESFPVNQYFIENPDMVLGEHAATGSMYGGNEYTLVPRATSLESMLSELLENRVPVGIVPTIAALAQDQSPMVDEKAFGTMFVSADGRVYQKTTAGVEERYRSGAREAIKVAALISMKDSARGMFQALRTGSRAEYEVSQKQLNEEYDSFQKLHGYINGDANRKLLLNDPDRAFVLALEEWDSGRGVGRKAKIFSRGFQPEVKVAKPTTLHDAYLVSFAETGTADPAYIADVLGLSESEVTEKMLDGGLVFLDHEDPDGGNVVSREVYLSGNVVQKLKECRRISEYDPRFASNVFELEKVQPRTIEQNDIILNINSPILEENDIKEFLTEKLKANVYSVKHVKTSGTWEVNFWANRDVWGTENVGADKLVDWLMNGKAIQIYETDEDEGSRSLNVKATNIAEAKADQIVSAFRDWVWTNPERRDRLVREYNERFNNLAPREYIHPLRRLNPDAEIRPSGYQFPYPLKPHQADAVWRIIQSKNSMLAHTVGAGKTLEMACAAMELRRLGIRQKPLIVCPDHMIGQWSNEFREAYPSAKLLIADDTNWDATNRKTFINSIAFGDWDCIVIRQHAFAMIPMSAERQVAFFEERIAEYQDELSKINKANKWSIKDIEKKIDRYKEKVKELMDMPRDTGILPFDDLGVDHLFIDEADMYKNLAYSSQLQNVRGMNTQTGSERAFDMYMKIRHLQQNGGGVTKATGTPISNSLVEAYVMQRYLQHDYLHKNGIAAFDEWARLYGQTVTTMETNNTGTGYKAVTRFSKIINVPELVTALREVWDIKTADDLEELGILVPGVNLPIKEVVNVAAPANPLLRSYLKHLEYREQNIQNDKLNVDNVLKILGDGRKASVDLRLINNALPDNPESKLNIAVRTIFHVYKETEKDRLCQAVFFDFPRSFERDDGKGGKRTLVFDGVKDMIDKLQRLGVPKAEIFDFRDCRNDKHKKEMQDKVNEGRIRIAFGSTGLMGAGTNFQRFLKAIHHIDVPYRPRDVEQQNGRGYRQGNTCGSITIYNYATKGSLDTGLWNILEVKDRSIKQIMKSQSKERLIEEDYYSSVKELSIEDEDVREQVDLSHQTKKLKDQYQAWKEDQGWIQFLLKSLPEKIEAEKKDIAFIQEDIRKRRLDAAGKDFSIIVEGVRYTERAKAGWEVIRAAVDVRERAKVSNRSEAREIGEFAGFRVLVSSTLCEPQSLASLRIATPSSADCATAIREDSDPAGLLVAFYGQIGKLDSRLETRVFHVTEMEAEQKGLIDKVQSAYPKFDELTAKLARLSELYEIVNQKRKNEVLQGGNDFPWKDIEKLTREEIVEKANAVLLAEEVVPPKNESLAASAVHPPLNHNGGIDDVYRSLLGFEAPSFIHAEMARLGIAYKDHAEAIERGLSVVATYRLTKITEIADCQDLGTLYSEADPETLYARHEWAYVDGSEQDPLGGSISFHVLVPREGDSLGSQIYASLGGRPMKYQQGGQAEALVEKANRYGANVLVKKVLVQIGTERHVGTMHDSTRVESSRQPVLSSPPNRAGEEVYER